MRAHRQDGFRQPAIQQRKVLCQVVVGVQFLV
jgi:hypothetical protein